MCNISLSDTTPHTHVQVIKFSGFVICFLHSNPSTTPTPQLVAVSPHTSLLLMPPHPPCDQTSHLVKEKLLWIYIRQYLIKPPSLFSVFFWAEKLYHAFINTLLWLFLSLYDHAIELWYLTIIYLPNRLTTVIFSAPLKLLAFEDKTLDEDWNTAKCSLTIPIWHDNWCSYFHPLLIKS